MQAAAGYYDFSALASLRADGAQNSEGNLREVAGQFESLFVQMMLQSMRDATPEGGLFDSHQMEGYQQMYDQQLSLELSTQGGIGLSEVIYRQLDVAGSLRPGDETPNFNDLPSRRMPSLQAVDVGSAGEFRTAVFEQEIDGEVTELNPENFVEHLRPLAEEAGRRLGVEPEVLLAQAALETGWGQHVLQGQQGSSNNLFNIKDGGDWVGPTVQRGVLEYRDGVAVREQSSFRAYETMADSFADYVEFLQSSPRYSEALAQAGDGEAYLRELQAAGYATDPRYADKVLDVRSRIDTGRTELALKDSAFRPLTD